MASMCFGYKTINKETGEAGPNGMDVRNAACWAPLKLPNENAVITEITWVPERGNSRLIKTLLPRLFPDVKYEEIHKEGNEKFPNRQQYAVRFTGLENVYRNNFMFRMFVIRNIDRDSDCNRSYSYLLSQGCDPLRAAAVAANITLEYNGFGRNASMKVLAKGYACCFSGSVTVADVKAFARDPSKLRNKRDWKFGEGRGFGYGPKSADVGGRITYTQDAVAMSCTGYKPSRPAFKSQSWTYGQLQQFMAKLFDNKDFLGDNLGDMISKTKLVEA